MIIISLFDEVEIDDRGGGGYLDDETSIRREKRFLGSVVLPFQVRNNVTLTAELCTGSPVRLMYCKYYIPGIELVYTCPSYARKTAENIVSDSCALTYVPFFLLKPHNYLSD